LRTVLSTPNVSGTAASVPEPPSLVLALLGTLGVIAFSRARKTPVQQRQVGGGQPPLNGGNMYPAAPECNLSAYFNFSALRFSVLN
jgi:hypothetical protein